MSRSYNLPNDFRTRGDVHLYHDQPDKSFDGIGTDLHALRNLFAGKSFHQELNCSQFARGQAIALCDLGYPVPSSRRLGRRPHPLQHRTDSTTSQSKDAATQTTQNDIKNC
jgi:hypothetical protein